MIELGEKIQLANDVTAIVVGWRRMLGANTEYCLTWWDGAQMVEQWMNDKYIKTMTDFNEQT